MPTILPGTTTEYILNGQIELLISAKELVGRVQRHEEALINLTVLESEQKSHSTMINSKKSYVLQGIFAASLAVNAAGITRAAIRTSSAVFPAIALGATLGGGIALVVDDCLTKANQAKRKEEIAELIKVARTKASSLETREQKNRYKPG